jgi:hypothetical protein
MKNYLLTTALIMTLLITSTGPAVAQGAAPKVAIHIEEYSPRVCHENVPELTRENITTTYSGVGRINAFVILYDYEAVRGMGFGLAWPETWQEPMWQDCGAVRMGAIHHPGDRTNLMLEKCHEDGEPIVIGWLSVTVTSPGTVEVLPSEAEGTVAVVDCSHRQPAVSEVMFTAKGGAGGAQGTELSQLLYMRNRTWHVRPDSTGDAVSITKAIKSSVPGDTVAVAGGTYNETVLLRNGVAVVGGFSPDFKERDFMTHPSIIDLGNTGNCVVGDLSEDSTCVLDGFVITGGDGNYGGGIALRNGSSPTLRNLIVYDNRAKRGGGIYCHASSPVIENVLVVGNEAETGGGIACNMGAAPRIMGATIAGNKASKGAGIFASAAAPYLERSIIAHHEEGDGITCDGRGATVSFACVNLWDNLPSDFGGVASEEMGLKDNISEDPMFVDAPNMDFTLSQGSPCLDVANCGRLGTTWAKVPRE